MPLANSRMRPSSPPPRSGVANVPPSITRAQITAARPGAAEGGTFATPERRAALEARIRELSNGIGDEAVRRYYRQDFSERLQRTFAPEVARGFYARGNNYRGAGNNFGESGRRFAPRGVFTPGAAGRFESRGGRAQGPARGQTLNRGPYQAASPQPAFSPPGGGPVQRISRPERPVLQSLCDNPL